MAFGIDSVLNIGSTIIDKIWPDAGEKERGKLQLIMGELAGQIQVLVTEMSGNWLQRSWRPILMLVIVAIVANNYLIYPYLSLFWPAAPTLSLPPELWQLMKIGVGGYVVGRSVEKGVDVWRNK
ncbi:hypothetical protein GO013_07340 [Pseudodesulfovibrio sp. JC047]|uniref:3TM-type holin n=1 Tax=Pseudodesulfovibrio sp. JC047 TaxID=2683199 RepID=UPI0013D34EC8|nr:3TM-type holin [Pseudodesulfovibrio sp. JC047]NDV19232.1 hypothetical protein [Pseudodesulfovibrio sp. JC047]